MTEKDNQLELANAYSPRIDLLPHVLTQCLLALESVIPFFNAIELSAAEGEAYDEWELLVQQFFNSFVILAITDGDTPAPGRYKKLGFAISTNKIETVIVAHEDNLSYYLNDIISEDGASMALEWIPLNSGQADCQHKLRTGDAKRFTDFKACDLKCLPASPKRTV